ncbi:MAG: hypothetical protein EBR30_27755 [Cytophagia bacterium]|nr:hypothetical protein [Cytophagia bacterium]
MNDNVRAMIGAVLGASAAGIGATAAAPEAGPALAVSIAGAGGAIGPARAGRSGPGFTSSGARSQPGLKQTRRCVAKSRHRSAPCASSSSVLRRGRRNVLAESAGYLEVVSRNHGGELRDRAPGGPSPISSDARRGEEMKTSTAILLGVAAYGGVYFYLRYLGLGLVAVVELVALYHARAEFRSGAHRAASSPPRLTVIEGGAL